MGGSVGYVDYCESDELSLIELFNMVLEFGSKFSAINFYTWVSGGLRILKTDLDAMGLRSLVDKDRVVKVFSVEEKEDEVYVGTQESQVGRPNKPKMTEVKVSDSRISLPRWTGPFPKTMGSLNKGMPQPKSIGTSSRYMPQDKTMETLKNAQAQSKPINVCNKGKGKTKVQDVIIQGMVDVQVDEEDDSDEYDIDSDTSDEDEVFYDSDYGLTDDDELFEQNVDRDVEFGGLNKKNTLSIDADYAAVIKEMADIEGGVDDSSDELNSGYSSSDEEGGSRKQERKYTVFNEKTEMDNPVFEVGMEFKTHDIFANAVKEYSIKHGKKIKFLKNDREKVRAKCEDGCDWLIYASYVPSDAVYRVKRYDAVQNCVRSFHVPWVSTKWILDKYCDRIRSNPTWPTKSLAETIEKERTVRVSIQKVYRARQMALELIQGSAEEQFQQLWGYVEEVRSSNPGTTIKMKVKLNTGSGNFAKFKRHLYNNFKLEFKGLALKDILWKAARASTVPQFNNAMDEMHQMDKMAYDWLCKRPPINWSRSHFSTYTKCDILLNNLCESFNSSILLARDKPIISMLEAIRVILMETVVKKRDAMKRCKWPVCPKIFKIVEKLKTNSEGWIPRWQGSDQFEVYGPNNMQYKVHLTNKTCGCRKWDISGIPCIHAIAALSFLNVDIFDYVHECYKVDTYLRTYNNLINPINGRDLWPTTENPTLLPPDVKKRVGRPKKARRREPEEPAEPNKLGRKGIKMTCRLCGNVGHNRRSCKRPAQASGENGETSGTVIGGNNVGSVAGAQGSGQTVQSGGTMRNANSGQCNGQTGQENARRPKLLVKKARKVNQSEGGSIVMSK
ncbi:hypothetical protein RHSIM_Rhsim03G0174600 [Rhododendron simsii]|uniref:SWIM-type domain-containing protein n=1 Tax=Rhododendron simsii TaxID=118357 RepID=A0A834H2T7_RHOSS|nr:hypothetical protein RHSIM_Rhsim03G0174600 [Rhododendron simsii]